MQCVFSCPPLLPAETNFGQGNIFTPVCHSVQGGGLGLVPGGGPPNFRGGGVAPIVRRGVLQIFGGGVSNFQNTVNVRAVRILLECILVHSFFRLFIHSFTH